MTTSLRRAQIAKIKDLGGLSEYLRTLGFNFTQQLISELAPALVEELLSEWPEAHNRTGSLKRALTYKISYGLRTRGAIRLQAGVRKKLSKSGKRRARRKPNEPNYGQFQEWLFKNRKFVDRAIQRVLAKMR